MNLPLICCADPRLEAVIFGADDFANDIGAVRTREGWEGLYARSALVTHCAVQVDPVQAAFTPSTEAIAQAQRILEADAQHQERGSGAFSLDGKMVDAPVVKAAARILARAQAAGKLGL